MGNEAASRFHCLGSRDLVDLVRPKSPEIAQGCPCWIEQAIVRAAASRLLRRTSQRSSGAGTNFPVPAAALIAERGESDRHSFITSLTRSNSANATWSARAACSPVASTSEMVTFVPIISRDWVVSCGSGPAESVQSKTVARGSMTPEHSISVRSLLPAPRPSYKELVRWFTMLALAALAGSACVRVKAVEREKLSASSMTVGFGEDGFATAYRAKFVESRTGGGLPGTTPGRRLRLCAVKL